jgi:hypothetical protein
MRRPALLIAGMLLATGTGLALASPASADVGNTGADSNRWHCHWSGHDRWYDNNDRPWDWSAQSANNDSRRWCHYRHHRHHRWHNWDNGWSVNAAR